MFSLIHNIISTSSHDDLLKDEKLELKTIKCVNRKGDPVNDVFFGNECSYKLKFEYSEPYWRIDITMYIRRARFIFENVDWSFSEIAKYDENIETFDYDNGFVLQRNKGFFIGIETTKPDFIYKYGYYHRWFQPDILPLYNVVCDPLVNKDCRVESDETTRTNYFREILGISKDKINTVEFKIRIICKVYCPVQKQDVKTTFETKRFRFGKNEEGKMVLKKAKEVKDCRKSEVKDQ